MSRIAGERHLRRCGEYYERLIGPLREVARAHGYALAVHGTLAYDIDLVACPWSEPLSEAKVLAEAIQQKAEEIIGFAFDSDRASAANPRYFEQGCPGSKPHGRLAWTFHLGGGPYIDLSVLAPGADPDPATYITPIEIPSVP